MLDWDRYSYVRNNPLRYLDPTGHFCQMVGSNQICSADPDSDGHWGSGIASKYNPYSITIKTAIYLFRMKMKDPHRGDTIVYSKFGQYRGEDPYTNEDRWHVSVDTLGDSDTGETVYPLYQGTVVATGWSGFGNYVLIEHDIYEYNFYSVYAHLGLDRDYNTGILVNPGDFVSTDTPIGIVGNSIGGFPFQGGKDSRNNPNETSIHLHFEVRMALNVNLTQKDPFAGKRFWAFRPGWSKDFVDLTSRYGIAHNPLNKVLPPP